MRSVRKADHFSALLKGGVISCCTGKNAMFLVNLPEDTCLQEIWLILPVVICLFQGLSHANARVLAFYAERSVYGSLNGLLSTQRRSALCSSDGITISK